MAVSSHPGKRPLLTIITVCRNIVGEIRDTCESVCSQTFSDFEWVVVDGASTDGTLEILEQYRSLCARFVSEPDRGIYHAMNKGLELARGRYLLFLNGGDYLASPIVLERVFAMNPTADIIYGNELFLYPELDFFEKRSTPPGHEINKLFFAYNIINHQAMFIKKDLFDRYGGYEERFVISADRERWIVFASHNCTFAKLDMCITIYRLGGISGQEKHVRRHLDELEQMRRERYGDEELREALRLRERFTKYRRLRSWFGNDALSLFSIDETYNGKKRKYRILLMPVLKVSIDKNVKRYYLFGFLKIWRTKLRGWRGAGDDPPGETRMDGRTSPAR